MPKTTRRSLQLPAGSVMTAHLLSRRSRTSGGLVRCRLRISHGSLFLQKDSALRRGLPPLLAGGGGRSNSVLATALAGHFRQVVVLHPLPSGLKTYVVSDAGATEVAPEVAWFGAFDVIQVCGRVDPVLVRNFRAASLAPVVFTSRSNAKALDRLGTRPPALERNSKQDSLVGLANAVVACSNAEAEELRLDYPQFAEKISFIHNALDPGLLSAIGRVDVGSRGTTEPAFAFVGRLRTHKGMLDRLNVCEGLWQEGLAFRFKIAGGHTHQGESVVQSLLARTLRLWPKWLEMAKWSADAGHVASVYRSVHCVISPSRYEPFGLVAVDRKSTRLNSSHANISYAVFCLKKT